MEGRKNCKAQKQRPPMHGQIFTRVPHHPTYRQAIDNHMANTARYRYVIFLNSSVRGPFLPAYWPVRRWQAVVVQLLACRAAGLVHTAGGCPSEWGRRCRRCCACCRRTCTGAGCSLTASATK